MYRDAKKQRNRREEDLLLVVVVARRVPRLPRAWGAALQRWGRRGGDMMGGMRGFVLRKRPLGKERVDWTV